MQDFGRVFKTVSGMVGPWVAQYIPEPDASAIAADSMVYILREALCGYPTPYGPYRAIFSHAETYIRLWSRIINRDVPFGIWRTVPMPTAQLLSDITRCYAAVYRGAELGETSQQEQDMLCTLVARGRFDQHGSWVVPPGTVDVSIALSVLTRIFWAMDSHRCMSNDGCREFMQLREHEAGASWRWYCSFLQHSGVNIDVSHQQDDHPGVDRPPVAVDHLAHDRH